MSQKKPKEKLRLNLSFRVLFVGLVIMTSIPALLVLSWAGYSGRQQAVELMSTTAADYSAGLAFSCATIDDIVTSCMMSLREQPSVAALDYVRCDRMFHERMAAEHLFSDILLVSANGDVLAAGGQNTPSSIAPILRSVPRLSENIYRAGIYSGEPYGKKVLPYIQGLHPDAGGNPQFALVLLVNGSVYDRAAAKIIPPNDMHYTLIDREGRFIFQYPAAASAGAPGEKLPDGIWERIKSRGNHGSLFIDRGDAPACYFGYTKLQDMPGSEPYMTVFTTLLQEKALANVSRDTSRSFVVILLSIAFISLTALFLGRKYIVLPIEKLVKVTKKFASGDLSQRAEEEGFSEEIAVLARSFDEMAFAIEQRVRLGRAIEAEVREQANKDFLTGSFNRRAGLSILGNTRELSLSNQNPFAIIFIDLDNFKMINDTYGHAEGDALLRLVSGMLISHLRADDVLCRYGGDEFLIVLPRCDEQGASEAWVRIQESVAQFNKDGTRRYAVGLSHGTAIFDPGNPSSLDELIETADKAMYDDKEKRKKTFGGTAGR